MHACKNLDSRKQTTIKQRECHWKINKWLPKAQTISIIKAFYQFQNRIQLSVLEYQFLPEELKFFEKGYPNTRRSEGQYTHHVLQHHFARIIIRYKCNTNKLSRNLKEKCRKKNLPSIAKRANLDAPILLNKGSLTCKSDTDCCNKLSPTDIYYNNLVSLEPLGANVGIIVKNIAGKHIPM